MSDDQTNPFVMAGMAGMMAPNKYTDPAFRNKALDLQGYRGTPTDAMGNPIQSFLDMQALHDAWQPPAGASGGSGRGLDPNFDQENMWLTANGQQPQLTATSVPGQLGPRTQADVAAQTAQYGGPGLPSSGAGVPGTTLNSTPQSAAPQGSMPGLPTGSAFNSSGQVSPYNIAAGNSAIDAGNTSAGLKALNSLIPSGNNSFMAGPGTPQGFWESKQPQGSQGASATNPYDMRQAYLDALARPQGDNKMITPGATVPQAQPLGTPSVMSSFLAAHPSGGQGAGNYNNQPFFDTLNKLRSA